MIREILEDISLVGGVLTMIIYLGKAIKITLEWSKKIFNKIYSNYQGRHRT